MIWAEGIIAAVGSLLGALAPSVAKAITGGQTPEEALAAAKEALAKLPQRAGDDGAWAADLGSRVAALPEDES